MTLEHTGNTPRSRRRRAPRCSHPMTSELASKAKTMVIQLGLAQHVAAARLGVNPGRISEAIHAEKYRDAPFAPLASLE